VPTSRPPDAPTPATGLGRCPGGHVPSPRCLAESCDSVFARDFAAPFPEDRVWLTSIYPKSDGVVRWQAALVPYGKCVQVTGSHAGLIFNREAYQAIATAVAEPELPSAWAALGHAVAAYDTALTYANAASSSVVPYAAFRSSKTGSSRCSPR
jgi:hypothetical protein